MKLNVFAKKVCPRRRADVCELSVFFLVSLTSHKYIHIHSFAFSQIVNGTNRVAKQQEWRKQAFYLITYSYLVHILQNVGMYVNVKVRLETSKSLKV